MERSPSGTAISSQPADPDDLDVANALAMADAIAIDFSQANDAHSLAPEVKVDLGVSWDDQTLFVFSIALDVDDTLDPADFPTEAVLDLKATLRGQIEASDLGHRETLVTVESKVGATGP